MARNLLLLTSTAALIALLFVAYFTVTSDTSSAHLLRPGGEAVPERAELAADQVLAIQDAIEIPPGGQISFRRFDPKTGRQTDLLSFDDWKKVAGGHNEIEVTRPELRMLLPSGMIALISADSGRLAAERIDRDRAQPKQGRLTGNARIVIDRETSPERRPADERPEDFITIEMDSLEFDLELGTLRTQDRVTLTSDDFEIAGVGVELEWNQAENLIERLLIPQGQRFVVFTRGGLLDTPGGAASATAPAADVQPTDKPAVAASQRRAARGGKAARRTASYLCTLTGGVVADQFSGDRRVAGLEAEELRLLFDFGGKSEHVLEREPTTRPDSENRDRLVVQWNGPLTLGPADSLPRDGRPRRRLEALGQTVRLVRGEASVRCGRVEFYDETQQAWLYPGADGRVDFRLSERVSASARSVYVDQRRGVIKLIGDVRLDSNRGEEPAGRSSSIRGSEWAELHLSRDPAADAARAAPTQLDGDRLESATFVGDVRVTLGRDQSLSADRLEVTFHPNAGPDANAASTAGASRGAAGEVSATQAVTEPAIDVAIASGNVRLSGADESMTCARLRLDFERADDGEFYPARLDAAGEVRVEQGRSFVNGRRMRADLSPPDAARGDRGALRLRSVEILGRGVMKDPKNLIEARGERIAATFTADNRLNTARVEGPADQPGTVQRYPYRVRGRQIDVDAAAETLHVEGPSRLVFASQRGVRGERRGRPEPFVVQSSRLLHVDAGDNQVRFEGDVRARSGDDSLRADALTLFLEEAPRPEGSGASPSTGPAGVLDFPALLTIGAIAEVGASFASPGGGAPWTPARAARVHGRERALAEDSRGYGRRKEPVRIVAERALAESETFGPQRGQPVASSSIEAPRMTIDLPRQQITTEGVTTLLLINRGLADEERAQREALGLPSALVSRGPSQTAMKCDDSLTYVIGKAGSDGAARRDSALFLGAVRFVHVAGSEMVHLAQMAPNLESDAELASKLKGRDTVLDCDRLECEFSADDGAVQRAASGRLATTALRLATLIAVGRVSLRDEQHPAIRSVFADRIEFERARNLIRVLGTPEAHARVYYENAQAAQADQHVGREFVIDLQANTIRAVDTSGEIRRQ